MRDVLSQPEETRKKSLKALLLTGMFMFLAAAPLQALPGYTEFNYPNVIVHIKDEMVDSNGQAVMQAFLDKYAVRLAYMQSLTYWSHDKIYGSKMEVIVDPTDGCSEGVTLEKLTYREVHVGLHNPMADSGCRYFYREDSLDKLNNPGELGDYWRYMATMLHESSHGIFELGMSYNNWWNEGFAVYMQYRVLEHFGDINRETAEYYIRRGTSYYNWDGYAAADYHDNSPDNYEIQQSEGYNITAQMLVQLEKTYGDSVMNRFLLYLDNNRDIMDTLFLNHRYMENGKVRNDWVDAFAVYLWGMAAGTDLVPTFRYDGPSGPGWGVRDWVPVNFLSEFTISSMTFSDSTPATLDTISARIRVNNFSNSDLSILVTLDVDGMLEDSVRVTVGHRNYLYVYLNLFETLSGDHVITAWADKAGLKVDTNRANNWKTDTLNFAGADDRPPLLDSGISNRTWSKNTSTVIQLADYFTEPEDSAMTWSAAGADSIGISIVQAAGAATLTPAAGWSGKDTVVFTARDPWQGTASNPVILTVINQTPVFSTMPGQMTPSGTEHAAYTDTVTAADPDAGDAVFYQVISPSPAGMTVGITTGIVTWTPGDSAPGTRTAAVIAYDAPGSADTLTWTIQVANINDAPYFTSSGVTAAVEDAAYVYDADAGDPDPGAVLFFRLLSAPAGMTVDSVTGVVRWTPDNDDVGDTSVSLQVRDDSGAVAVQSFSLQVLNTNDPPRFTSAPVSAAVQDQAYTYAAGALDPDAGAAVRYSLVVSPAGMAIDSLTGVVGWIPAWSQTGDNPVSIRASDDSAAADTQSFVLQVQNVNDAPVFITTVFQMTNPGYQQALYTDTVSASDRDGDVLKYRVYSGPAGYSVDSLTGIINWTPAELQTGMHSLLLGAEDGSLSDTLQFQLFIMDVNHSPYFLTMPGDLPDSIPEGRRYQDTVYASDPDTMTILVFSLVSGPPAMYVDAGQGVIVWTPSAGDIGSHPVSIRVTDQLLSDTLRFVLNVFNFNEPPRMQTLAGSMTPSVLEDLLWRDTLSGTDVDGDVLTYRLVQSPAGMTCDSTSGILRWRPGNGDVGVHSVSAAVWDGSLGDTLAFNLMVVNTQDAPVVDSIRPGSAVASSEGSVLRFTVFAHDIDAGSVLHYQWRFLRRGVVSGMGDSSGFVWNAGFSTSGTDTLKVIVSDGMDSDSAVWPLSIANVPLPPRVLRPANGDYAAGDSLLSWTAARDPDLQGPVFYRLEIGSDSAFTAILAMEDSLGDTAIYFDSLAQAGSLPIQTPLYWRAAAYDGSGYTTGYSHGVNAKFFFLGTTVSLLPRVPDRPFMSQNFPNPFGSLTFFSFGVPPSGTAVPVTLDIFDMSGHKIENLITGQLQPGYHRAAWESGPHPPGMYICRIRIGDRFVRRVRMVKLK